MLEHPLPDPALWEYITIPLVAAFVGWFTNLVAIKMLFYPLEPWGRPPLLGWHGIIPSKAAKMGAITTDTTLSKLGTLEDIFGAMEPARLEAHLIQSISPRVEEYVEEIVQEEKIGMWEMLPGMMKSVVYASVRQSLPRVVHRMVEEIGTHIDELVDLKEMVVQQVTAAPRIVNRIFLECGAREFQFIIRSGAYFGFGFGLLQALAWYFYQGWWTLPLAGVVVGYATNWIALRIVFQPVRPRRIGPWTLQGLFLKRQQEVSAIWCNIVTEEVLTVRILVEAMLTGSRSRRTQGIVRKHIRQVVDEALGLTKPVVQLTVGLKEFQHLKETASEKVLELTTHVFDDPQFNEERAQDIRAMMTSRMRPLSAEEVQYLLRPAFQEEELKLILLGGVLGFLTGLLQAWVMR